MMTFVHFIGVTSTDELKKKYRTLAMEHHPDKGGRSEVFIALKKEYEYILNNGNVTYPIVNRPQYKAKTVEDIMREAQQRAQSRAYAPPRPKATTEEDKWNAKIINDPSFTMVDSLIDVCIAESRTANYLLMEVYKMEEMTLAHFQFMAYKLKKQSFGKMNIHSEWAKETYRIYTHIHELKWV